MKFILFASGKVGYQVAEFLGKGQELISCLVLDSVDRINNNAAIIEASRVTPEQVIYSDEIYAQKTISKLRLINADLGVLAWWPFIIKDPVLEIPRLGMLNFHPSFLPYNRGKHYNFWTIVEDVPFGVTIHWVDRGVDTGDIAFQAIIEKTWEDTGETLYEKAQTEIVRLFIDNFPRIIRSDIPRIPQNANKGSYHKANELDIASRIDLDNSYLAKDLLNIIRARTFPPYPAAWFKDGDQVYEVRIDISKRNDDEKF